MCRKPPAWCSWTPPPLTAFGTDAIISRSGYTGEDGYEISVPATEAARIWNTLLEDERVKAIGLGARDSLRLEAGLPLYGHDMDETVSPDRGRPGLRRRQEPPRGRRLSGRGPDRQGTGRRPRARARQSEGAGRRPGPRRRRDRRRRRQCHRQVVTSGGFGPSLWRRHRHRLRPAAVRGHRRHAESHRPGQAGGRRGRRQPLRPHPLRAQDQKRARS